MQRRTPSRGVQNRRGSTFVEAALVIMIVLVTLIGIVDVGQVLVLHQGLVERVRAGARYAVVNASVNKDTGAISLNETRVKNVIRFNDPNPSGGGSPLLNLNDESLIQIRAFGGNTPEARIEVSIINYPIHFFTPGLKGNGIKGDYYARPITAVMPLEDPGGVQP